ncbi:hypothetical protein K9M41_01650 [Candidatus Gracilibacteria bacterium]|nr:hypothetical protein [Candidatus Gracilibacteria bacterium]
MVEIILDEQFINGMDGCFVRKGINDVVVEPLGGDSVKVTSDTTTLEELKIAAQTLGLKVKEIVETVE